MDEHHHRHLGRRTVGGLLSTKGGSSILLFREDDGSRRNKANSRRPRHGSCSTSRHSVDKRKGKELHRAAVAAVPNESAPATPQVFKNRDRKPPRPPHESSASSDCVVGRDAGSSGVGETGSNRSSRDTPGRDLLARLKERVNASRKRSMTRENSPPSSSTSSNGLSASSSSPSTRSISRPSHRAASRYAGPGRSHRNNGTTGDSRTSSERSDDGLLFVEQITRDHEQPAAEGFVSGLMERYRRSGLVSSLEDTVEGSNGYYWRFDMGETEELENYFMFNDRHRGMRMDIDGMSYEELLALGERIGTVNTGLSDDALPKCLNRGVYMPTASSSHEDCDRKCSICQEEYIAGEEVGKMACKHYYHISCIQHWLQQKNWCPICKSDALHTN